MLSTKRLALALWIFVPLQAANTSTTEPSRCSAETSETAFLQSQAHIDSLSDMMSTAKPKKIKVKNIIDKPDSWFVVYLHARLQQFDEAGNGDGCLTRDEYSNFDALVDVLQGPSLLQKEKLEKPWRRWRRRYYSHGSTSTTSTTSAPRADLEELCFNTTLSPSSLVTEGIVEDIQVFREFLEGYKTSLFAGMEDQYQFLVKARAELLEKILPRLSRDPLGLEYLGTDPLAEYASLNVSQAELEQEIIRVYDLLDFYDQRISELEEFLENPKSIVDDALKNYLPDQLGDDNMTEDTDDTNDPVTSFVGRGENKAKEAKPARPALVQSQRKSRILQHAFGQDSNSKQGPDGRCIYGRRDTCLFRIGDIPLLGTHNAGAYPRMRFRCPDQVQSCQEWNTVNLQACFDERDGICRTERFAVCEPQNRDNIFDCEAKYLCLDVLYDGAVCGTTQAGCYAGGAFRWSGCRLIPVAQGLVCAGGSVLRTIRQFRSCANAVISGPATCSALGPRANLLPQGVVSCLFENQGYNLIGQLNRGVRLFDLDTCLGWDPWWLILCHGTGTESAGGRQLGLVLFEIKAWLNQNRHEVVVIRWSDKGNQLPHLYPAERARFGDLDAYHDAAREWHVNRAFPRRTPQTDPTWTTDWTKRFQEYVSSRNERLIVINKNTFEESFEKFSVGGTDAKGVVDKLEQYCTWSNGGATRDRPVMLSAFSRIFSRVGWSRRDPEVLDCDANRQRGDIDCPDGWSSDRRTLSIDSIVNGLRGLASGEGICNDANARVVNFELANRLDGLLRTCSDNGVKVAAVLVDYVGMSNERIRQSINAMISRQVLFRDRERAQQPPNTQLPVEVVGVTPLSSLRCGRNPPGSDISLRCPFDQLQCCSRYGWCGDSANFCGDGCQTGYGRCNAAFTDTQIVNAGGRCGSSFNSRCSAGLCCSSAGWCGTSDAHCGVGCQASYSNGCRGVEAVTADLPVLPSSRCGPSFQGRCGDGLSCCSGAGWCGNSPAHCGDQCQPSYGTCNADQNPSLPVTTDGTCGPGRRCATGLCCSQYGWCGTSTDHCDGGCLPLYGRCN